MNQSTIGLSILIVAGLMNASFTLPMKFTRRWAWENTWLLWTIFALLLLPPAVAILTVPQLGNVYCSVEISTILSVAGFGFGWGIAQIFFGLAVESIGIALTFSLVLGTSAAVGTLLPLLRLRPERLHTHSGHSLLAGVFIALVGVAMCAVAGRSREAKLRLNIPTGHKSSTGGLVLAVICGFGASFVNFGLAFGIPLLVAAQRHGAGVVSSANAVWLPLMLAGAIPNLFYCIVLMRKNQTTGRFSSGGFTHWILVAIMAVLWFGSTLLYGAAASHLGVLGPILGWPLFMSLIVITASLLGVLTGEWKNAGRKPLLIQLSGVAILIIAVFVLAATSRNLS
jgi:L-rhamnose-H+ transport protein